MNTISEVYLKHIEESLKSDMSVRANQMLSEPGPKPSFVKEPGGEEGKGRLGLSGLSGLNLRPFLTYKSEGPKGLGKGTDNVGSNNFDGVRRIFGNLKDRHRGG